MADLYTRQTWADGSAGGTPITAARLRKIEEGIDNLDTVQDDHGDRLDAIEASLGGNGDGGGGGGTPTSYGPTANRPAPADGVQYYDTTINQPIWGDGSAWRDAAGALLGGSGSSAAPTNFRAVTQPDQSILCTWTAVPGASSYKLYESRSLSGVTGATAIVGTSISRSPATLGNYEYWVTATVNGVESASSNHSTCVLPYPTGGGGGGGGPTGSTPAAILNIGTGAGQNYFNEGIGYNTGHVDKTMAQIAAGFIDNPFFTPNASNNAVQFRINMDGKTTSTNTKYTRSELRELLRDGTTKAAWTASGGTHTMTYTFKLLHLQPKKPWVTIGQIHDASSDALSIKIKGDSTSALQVVAVFNDADQSPALISNYTIGDTVTIKIELINGTLKLYANGALKITSTAISGAKGCYFKLGVYPQSKDNAGGFESPSEYCSAEISNLTVTHSTTN